MREETSTTLKMKYLENDRLESLTAFLSNREMGGRMINGRVEVAVTSPCPIASSPYPILCDEIGLFM